MRTKIITAVFKGQNGSCGYQTNKTYALKIKELPSSNIEIELAGGNEENMTEYSNIITFLDNWTEIKVMNQ